MGIVFEGTSSAPKVRWDRMDEDHHTPHKHFLLQPDELPVTLHRKCKNSGLSFYECATVSSSCMKAEIFFTVPVCGNSYLSLENLERVNGEADPIDQQALSDH